MTGLILTRGYPGSGKTTWAKDWVTCRETENVPRARVSRDDLRETVFGRSGVLDWAREQHISDLQHDAARKLLKRGYDVVVDDLNLKRKYAVVWAEIAHEQQAGFDVLDFAIPADQCIQRDLARQRAGQRAVGEDAIRKIAARFPIGRWPSLEDIQSGVGTRLKAGNWVTYDNPTHDGLAERPRIVLVDLDGTVALKDRADGARGWHEYHRVGEDLPNHPVIEMVRLLHEAEHAKIVFLSGRKDSCFIQTRGWLVENVGDWTLESPLFMRRADDNRSDDIVKHELFDQHVRDRYHVVGVFDDRDRVVEMWRAIGLQVYQVAPGNF